MDQYYEIKEKGEDARINKYKNRGKMESGNPNHYSMIGYNYHEKIGNSISENMSSPGCNLTENNRYQRTLAHESKLIKNEDISYEEDGFISFEKEHMNKNIKKTTGKQRIIPPKIINLPLLHEKLYLGNLPALDHVYENNVSIIINITQPIIKVRDLKECNWHDPDNRNFFRNLQIYNFPMKDKKSISYKEFKTFVKDATIPMVENFESDHPKKIIVVCNRGVNRSVSVIIAYAIMHLDMNFNSAFNYISERKAKYDTTWDCLSSIRLRNLLYALNSDGILKLKK